MGSGVSTFVLGSADELDDAVRALEALGFQSRSPVPLTATLLDTFDGRLYDAGLELRAAETDETVLVLTDRDGTSAHLTVPRPPRFANELPAGPFRARLEDVVESRVLLPKVALTGTTTRLELHDAAGKLVGAANVGAQLRLGDDDVIGPFIELEELVGYPKPARRANQALEELGLTGAPGIMITVAAGLAGIDLKGFDGSPEVSLDVAGPAIDGMRAVLAKLADAIAANAPGTIERLDPEFLHDLRVAVRRTRSVLSHAKGVLPDDVRARAQTELRQMSDLTGPPRDLDVYLLGWDGYTSALGPDVAADLEPVRTRLLRDRDVAYAALIEHLQSPRAASMLAAWQSWLRDPLPEDLPEKALQPLGRVVAKRIEKAQATLLDQGRAITEESPPTALHDLRKDAKKLRYLLECFGGVLATGPRKLLVKQLKALQENLGLHQDAEVHMSELQAISSALHDEGASARTMLAIGRLVGSLDQVLRDTREQFAARFEAYDTATTHEALVAALEKARARA